MGYVQNRVQGAVVGGVQQLTLPGGDFRGEGCT